MQLKKLKMHFLEVHYLQIWPNNNNAKPTCTTSQTDFTFSIWMLKKNNKMMKHCLQRMTLKKAKMCLIIHHLSLTIRKDNNLLWRKLIINQCFKKIQLWHTFLKQNSKSTWLKKCFDLKWNLYLIQLPKSFFSSLNSSISKYQIKHNKAICFKRYSNK